MSVRSITEHLSFLVSSYRIFMLNAETLRVEENYQFLFHNVVETVQVSQ